MKKGRRMKRECEGDEMGDSRRVMDGRILYGRTETCISAKTGRRRFSPLQ